MSNILLIILIIIAFWSVVFIFLTCLNRVYPDAKTAGKELALVCTLLKILISALIVNFLFTSGITIEFLESVFNAIR